MNDNMKNLQYRVKYDAAGPAINIWLKDIIKCKFHTNSGYSGWDTNNTCIWMNYWPTKTAKFLNSEDATLFKLGWGSSNGD